MIRYMFSTVGRINLAIWTCGEIGGDECLRSFVLLILFLWSTHIVLLS